MITLRIPYDIDDMRHSGRLVYDQATGGKRPIVLIGPNFMGVTAEAVERAQMFAAFGYAAFVVDPYGESDQPADHEQAGVRANILRRDPQLHRRRMQAALEAAITSSVAAAVGDPTRVGAVGFCLGGGSVLELARSGALLSAVVSIHGDLTTSQPCRAGDIKASVLALHGSEDPISPRAHRDAFEDEMQSAGVNWRLVVFGGLIHAFTDVGVDVPGIAKYDEAATRATYLMARSFLDEAFAHVVSS